MWYLTFLIFSVYSDRVTSSKKSDIFSRLHKSSKEDEAQEGIVSSSGESSVRVHITGVNKLVDASSNNSVFARLGGKQSKLPEEANLTKEIKSILKNTQRSGVTKNSSIVKAKNVAASATKTQQKVMLVHKVPLKRGDDDDDSMDDRSDGEAYISSGDSDEIDMTVGEKIVKFASTAEVREIAPETSYKARHGKNLANNLKTRLGLGRSYLKLESPNQITYFSFQFSIQTACYQEDLQFEGISNKERATRSIQSRQGKIYSHAQRGAVQQA